MGTDREGAVGAAVLTVREVNTDDAYEILGLLDCLRGLSPTGLSVVRARDILASRRRKGIRTLVAVLAWQVVGTCSLLIEEKLTHSGGLVGHLEDVVVRESFRGQGVGKALVQEALSVCRQLGCYKVILDCDAEVAPFYESPGFSRNGICMRMDLESGITP